MLSVSASYGNHESIYRITLPTGITLESVTSINTCINNLSNDHVIQGILANSLVIIFRYFALLPFVIPKQTILKDLHKEKLAMDHCCDLNSWFQR